jgi:hypothetical protein
VVGCRRKHDDDDDEKEECFVFALWWCCCVAVWIKWKNKGKKQLSEYQRQCHVFLTNESLVRQEKSTRTKNKPVRRGCEISFFRLVPILLLLQSSMRVYITHLFIIILSV